MTSSNRFLNRLLLLVIGLLALVAAALVGWSAATGTDLPFALPEQGTPLELGIVLAAAVVVVVFAVAWVLTRGRGRRRLAIDTPEVQVDAKAIEALLRSELSASPDIAGTSVQAYRVRRQQTLLVTVQARKHPDLTALTASVRQAIARTDAQLGATLPLVVHVTTGLRTAMAGQRATH